MKTYLSHILAMLSLPRTSSLRKTFHLGILTLMAHSGTWAALTNVNIEPFAFDPSVVTINVNDQVRWTWVSDFHNTVSATSLWDSGVHNTGFMFTHTFTSAGAFPYSCTVHGFDGTVNVQGANSPPTVAISSPTNGASFTAPANVPITATAQDSEGSVTNVSFFDGSTFLGATNNPPYTVTANLAVVGHMLTAVATDDAGLSSTSGVVNVTVVQGSNSPPTVTISSPTNGATFTAPASIPITAAALDSDGSVTNVSFFDGSTFLGATTNPPYTVTADLAVGSHMLTAVAADDAGLASTSSVVNVTVSAGSNTAPSVTITNPVNNAALSSSAAVTIRSSALDTDGTVTNVQYFDEMVLLGNATNSPYSLSVRLAIGMHTLTAVAYDNLGASGTSAPVQVTMARYLPALTNGEVAILLQAVATNMAAPLYAISPPGDTSRLFVLEQNGLVRLIQNGTLLATPALVITNRVQPPLNANSPNDERGLLGLAFHPGYTNPASPGFRTLYTYNSEMIPTNTVPSYPVPTTATNNYKNVVNEWKISSTNANVIDPASRREVISFGKTAGNHNGGTIAFGPDGYLYLALGDGGDANDVGVSHIEPGGNAQNLSTPLGKMLRFDPLDPALPTGSSDPVSSNAQYRIPATNPFQGPGQVPEIYAYGLRNPYRFCFDRANGELILADVGQNNIEEINRITNGGNYGWAIKEGDFLFNRTNGPAGAAGTIGNPPGNRSPGNPAGLIDPLSGPQGTLEYDHNEGISITGGFVYRGTAIPELVGKYIFGDLALRTQPVRADGRLFYADIQAGTINAFPLPQFGGTAILPNGLTVHGFGEDADGELYALVTNTSANGTGGIVYKLVPAVRLTATLSGNALEISWPVAGWRLQSQTNGLGMNWSDVPDTTTTNRVVVPIDAVNTSVFYRLALP
jgi:glucose/arabinose dehydrogenase/plastocyanin